MMTLRQLCCPLERNNIYVIIKVCPLYGSNDDCGIIIRTVSPTFERTEHSLKE